MMSEVNRVTSLFRCPLCSAPLTRGERGYLCPGGHCFDVAAAGYTHLLPANRKHSKNPGDDKAMVAARSAFLDRGYYAPLREALTALTVRLLADSPSPALLDSGCGEGYYTAGLCQALMEAGHTPRIAGVDLSKFALKRAARRLPANVFSPLATEEFARVLMPGGYFLYVVPSSQHLWELKQVLYDHPYKNPVKTEDYPGFVHREALPLRFSAKIDRTEDIMALFGMTPYAWKTPKEGVDRLRTLTCLDTQVGFDIHVYQRA